MMREAMIGFLTLMFLLGLLAFTIYAKATGLFNAQPADGIRPAQLVELQGDGSFQSLASRKPLLVDLPDNETNQLVDLGSMERVSAEKIFARNRGGNSEEGESTRVADASLSSPATSTPSTASSPEWIRDDEEVLQSIPERETESTSAEDSGASLSDRRFPPLGALVPSSADNDNQGDSPSDSGLPFAEQNRDTASSGSDQPSFADATDVSSLADGSPSNSPNRDLPDLNLPGSLPPAPESLSNAEATTGMSASPSFYNQLANQEPVAKDNGEPRAEDVAAETENTGSKLSGLQALPTFPGRLSAPGSSDDRTGGNSEILAAPAEIAADSLSAPAADATEIAPVEFVEQIPDRPLRSDTPLEPLRSPIATHREPSDSTGGESGELTAGDTILPDSSSAETSPGPIEPWQGPGNALRQVESAAAVENITAAEGPQIAPISQPVDDGTVRSPSIDALREESDAALREEQVAQQSLSQPNDVPQKRIPPDLRLPNSQFDNSGPDWEDDAVPPRTLPAVDPENENDPEKPRPAADADSADADPQGEAATAEVDGDQDPYDEQTILAERLKRAAQQIMPEPQGLPDDLLPDHLQSPSRPDDASLAPVESTPATRDPSQVDSGGTSQLAGSPIGTVAESPGHVRNYSRAEIQESLRMIELQPGESLAMLSQRLYGSPDWARALFQFNRRRASSSGEFAAGTRILFLPRPMLRFLYPDSAPTDPSNPQVQPVEYVENADPNPAERQTQSGPPMMVYQTRGGETLFGLAAEYLGQASRYTELMEINRSTLGGRWGHADKLPAGLKLQFPID